MDIFEYKGRNEHGEIMQGTIEAANAKAVASWMMSSGIYPIQVRLQGNDYKSQPGWLRELLGTTLTLRDLLLFTRQMTNMIKAGIPMLEALAGIQKSSTNLPLVELLREVRADLEKGLELSGALARHPDFFDEYYVSMVRVGEGTGKLEEIFQRLFEQYQFQDRMGKKIKGALRYPTFVAIAISVAIAIMTLFVIPVFAKMYANFHAQLPFLTTFLLSTSQFAVDYWWVLLSLIAGLGYGLKSFIKLPKGRYVWDKLKLSLPVVGDILKKATLARLCSSFATAISSGVPIVQAFTMVSRVVDNAFYERRILLMRHGVERGESILHVAQSARIFSPLELQMISVGEATGSIDSMLNQVADMYQEEVDYEVSRLSETIEPILLIFMGILILILMLGIFMPMWQLAKVATLHQ